MSKEAEVGRKIGEAKGRLFRSKQFGMTGTRVLLFVESVATHLRGDAVTRRGGERR